MGPSAPSGVPARSMACHSIELGTYGIVPLPVAVPTGKELAQCIGWAVNRCFIRGWALRIVELSFRGNCGLRLYIFGFMEICHAPCAMWTCVCAQEMLSLAAYRSELVDSGFRCIICGSIDLLGCMHASRTTDDTKRGLGWRSGSKGLGIHQGPLSSKSGLPASPARTRRSLAPPSVYTEQGKVYAFRPISNCTATMSATGSRLWGWIPACVFQRAYVRVHRGVSA